MGKVRSLVVLTLAQVQALEKLHSKHLGYAHIYDDASNREIIVEFGFPYRYIIFADGTIKEDFA